jgi:hypothetical protein
MLKLGEALRTHKLISAATEAALWAPLVPAEPRPGREGKLSYGYGFARLDRAGGDWAVGHGGGSLGVNAEFEYFPASASSNISRRAGAPQSSCRTSTRPRRPRRWTGCARRSGKAGRRDVQTARRRGAEQTGG